MINKKKKRILIDLDGVLNEYDGVFDENKIPPIKLGAKEFLENITFEGCELYLFTSRNLLLSAKWLIENNIDKYFKDITNIKISSYIIIDDRSLCFDGDYERTINKIKNFETFWNRNKTKEH